MTALELINKIATEHSRTSCSDDDLSNKWYNQNFNEAHSHFYQPRCTRCSLLAIAEGEELQEDREFVVYLETNNKNI